ncbi:ATP-binding cassette domain-containing protein, partial [Klebsiella pneumoniae]|uniref:ATP-binding cassette domain-containing protein n=1 Tax=Klebsiella pneumoniae TaxID=573 RepID=UPI003CCAD6C1
VISLSLQLRAGENHGQVGESGSGKSTTCLALLGLMPSGSMIIFDVKPFQSRNRRQLQPLRRHINSVFQDSKS